MAVSGQTVRAALAAVGAVGKQIRSFDELAAGADGALRSAPAGLTPAGAAAFLATCAVESAWFRTTQEYGSRLRYDPYRGRTFVQLTWVTNYRGFGRWCHGKGLVSDPEVFVKNPGSLADFRWAWLGAIYYFEAHGIWRWANAGNFRAVSQAINGGNGRVGTSFVPNGWAERQKMYRVFLAVGAALLPSGAPAAGGGAGPESVPRLHEGDTGPQVRHVQAWLNATFPAYSALDLGPQRYGPATTAVIAEFQRRAGITGGDGRNIGPSTAAAMWQLGYRPPGSAAATAAAVPSRRPRGDEMFFQTAEPESGQDKWDWPTIRVPFAFEPLGGWGGRVKLKVDHGGRGGWIHLLRWWVRDPNWTPNVPRHSPQDHPVGSTGGHAGSERFVGYGWESAPPAKADMLELVLSAPDGVHIRDFYEK